MTELEPGDAPAQAVLNNMGYYLYTSYLGSQGCLGKLPKHMTKARKLSVSINGVPLYTKTSSYIHGVENGRLVSLQDESGITYDLTWK